MNTLHSMYHGIQKWLPAIFGCHCRPDRSFFWHGHQFPLCARCTGELLGIILCACTIAFYRPPLWVSIVGLIPLIIDGTLQLKTAYESTNIRRLITGLLFGYSLIAFIVITSIIVYGWGVDFGASFFH